MKSLNVRGKPEVQFLMTAMCYKIIEVPNILIILRLPSALAWLYVTAWL